MAALPVEVYEVLEEKFGKEDAKTILHALEKSLNAIKIMQKLILLDFDGFNTDATYADKALF